MTIIIKSDSLVIGDMYRVNNRTRTIIEITELYRYGSLFGLQIVYTDGQCIGLDFMKAGTSLEVL
jgi:hypothetical protein